MIDLAPGDFWAKIRTKLFLAPFKFTTPNPYSILLSNYNINNVYIIFLQYLWTFSLDYVEFTHHERISLQLKMHPSQIDAAHKQTLGLTVCSDSSVRKNTTFIYQSRHHKGPMEAELPPTNRIINSQLLPMDHFSHVNCLELNNRTE